jgi:hypothetical protein
MPGHVDGIYAAISLVLQSPDPMTYDNKDWRAVEKALQGLLGRKLGDHKIVEVSVDTLRPTASSISKHTHERPGGRAGKGR